MSTEIIGKVTTTADVEAQLIDDILCTAFEGGITYWVYSVKPLNNVWPDNAEYVSECLSRGIDIVIQQMEEDTEHILTMEKMLMGIERFCNRNASSVSDLSDDHDAGDADCIIQYALFGEIVYG